MKCIYVKYIYDEKYIHIVISLYIYIHMYLLYIFII